MKFLIALLLISLIQVIVGEGESHASSDGDPRYDIEFYQKVYAFGGEALNPSETLRLLKLLEEKYVTRLDEESVAKYKRVRELLDIAEMNQRQCEKPEEIFKRISRELTFNHQFVNVVEFLNYYRDIQFSLCKETLESKLHTDVELLPKSIGDTIKQFKESVLAVNTDRGLKERAFRFTSQASVIDGVAHYLEHQLDPFVEKVLKAHNGVKVYNTEFDNLIREPCRRLTLEKAINLRELKLLTDDLKMLKRFNPFTLEWLENFNLCLALIVSGERNAIRIRDISLSQLLKTYTAQTIMIQQEDKRKKGY